MDSTNSTAKANAFREMHRPGDPVVLVNVWDVASARVVASQPEVRALATASWSVCAATGYADGGDLPLDVALLAARRIVESTELPVTVDFEKGYADSTEQLKANILALIETGAIGLNIEDSLGTEEGELWSVTVAAERVAAVRSAATDSGVPIVINARTDVLVSGGSAADAIERGRAFLESGADCVFILGATGKTLDEVVSGIPGPVSVLAGASSPPISALAAAGVARVSFGPGPMGHAYAALSNLVRDVHEGQPYPQDLGFRPGRS